MYTTRLQAGLGLIEETRLLLELWSPGMTPPELNRIALQSGRFPSVSARRLHNIVAECFAPRYLTDGGVPAICLKRLEGNLIRPELYQFFQLFTARANTVLGDFVREVYWQRYAAGYSELSSEEARGFLERAIDDGKTEKRWAASTVRRVAGYLTGCCADYGLLEGGARTVRRILPLRIAASLSTYLAYDLHFQGFGDNAILCHPDWGLYGLERADVLEEMKQLSLRGYVIAQAAGDVVDISWRYADRETLYDALIQR